MPDNVRTAHMRAHGCPQHCPQHARAAARSTHARPPARSTCPALPCCPDDCVPSLRSFPILQRAQKLETLRKEKDKLDNGEEEEEEEE